MEEVDNIYYVKLPKEEENKVGWALVPYPIKQRLEKLSIKRKCISLDDKRLNKRRGREIECQKGWTWARSNAD